MKEPFSILSTIIIANRLIWKTMFFAALLIILFTVIIGAIAWFNGIKEFEERCNEIKKSYLDVIREAMWVDDKENMKIILMSISRSPGIEYADIHSKDNIICKAGKKISDVKLNFIFPIVYTYNNNIYTLGKLHVKGSMDDVRQKILKAVLGIALSQALIIIIFCILVLFAMHRILIGRLLNTTEYASSLSLDSLDTPLVMDQKTKHPDELNDLVNAINHTQVNLHQAFTR